MHLYQAAKPTLFIILSRFPYPLEKGDKLRAFNQIVGLSNHFTIILICLTDHHISDKNKQALYPYCRELHVFKLNKLLQLIQLILNLFREKPFQTVYFWQFHIHKKIKKLIYQIKPDYIFSQLIRTTEYVKDYHVCPKILDYMDAFSKGVERRIAEQNWFTKLFFKQEFIRLKNYERSIFEYFEEHIIISEQDRNYIFHSRSEEIAIVKNGVSEQLLNNQIRKEKKYDLIFTGNMSYPPNVAASNYIAKKILPILNRNTSLLISGVNPTKSVLNLKSFNITVTGWVENISESYLQSKIFIAPMFLGTGLQNKLLEAMALGIPCVTSTMANTALGAVPEESILIADNEIEFKTQIERLLNDESLYNTISINAYSYVKTNFSWDRLNEQLTELIVNSTNKMLI
jgi:glycosyltransferase involved in cell wall biosynthesis